MYTYDYLPPYYPAQRHQWVYVDGVYYGEAGVCVPCTIGAILEVQNYRMTGMRDVYFSSYWIFGNRTATMHQDEDAMWYEETLDRLKTDGCITTRTLNDNLFYSDFSGQTGAKNKVASIYSERYQDSRVARIDSYDWVWAPNANTQTIQSHIQNHGAVMLTMQTFNTFYNLDSTGILPYTDIEGVPSTFGKGSAGTAPTEPPTAPPTEGGESTVEGHSMAVLGWKFLYGKLHWICQNSWGSGWGDNGFVYIPYDHKMLYYSHFFRIWSSDRLCARVQEVKKTEYTSTFVVEYAKAARATETVIDFRKKGDTTWQYWRTTTSNFFGPNSSIIKGDIYEFRLTSRNEYGDSAPVTTEVKYAATIGAITTLTLTPSTATIGVLYASWNTATGADKYAIQVYEGAGTNADKLVYSNYGLTTTSDTITGLKEATLYTVSVYAISNELGNGTAKVGQVTMKDFTAPSVSITGQSGLGSLSISWTASDSGVGLASTNRYRVFVGTRNGDVNTLAATTYTNSTYYEWFTDANGYSLVHDAYYWVGVRAYDKDGNSTLATTRIQYKSARPNNWTKWDSVSSGSTFSLSASDWNAFTARINEFRLYKGYSEYSFTQVYSGQTAYATQVNEAINAIKIMNANVTSARYSGQDVTAAFVKAIAKALNDIS